MNKPTVLLRYHDLVERGIVRNREGLRVLIADHGFPAGFFLTPNAKVFEEHLVEEWLERRRQATANREAA